MKLLRYALGLGTVMGFLVTVSAQAPPTLAVELQRAIQKEGTTRDLKAAIADYKAIVGKAGADKRIAAQALLRMAECYQKLGDADARRIYERIVREYADQTDAAAIARTRLGSAADMESQTGILLRKILDDSASSISEDGRYLSSGPVVRDMASGTEWRWNHPSESGGAGQGRVLSRDGTQIAYEWCTGFQICEVRIASVKGAGVPTPRRLFSNAEIRLHPRQWSPDGKWIAVTGLRKDGTGALGLLAVQDGSFRVLKSIDWRGSTGVFFSPDGRDLAFDLSVGDINGKRDILVIAANGSREIPAVVNAADDVVMGWSPDGKSLLFTSDRGGTRDLWAQPFVEGRPQGFPERLKTNIGSGRSLGITKAGALYFVTPANERDIEVASIDLNSGRAGASVRPPQRFSGTNFEPAWSADGRFLAYLSQREGDLRGGIIAIHSMISGEVRELAPQPQLAWMVGLSWAPDGRSIALTGVDEKGRSGIFRLDTHTGDLSSIVVPIPLTYEGAFWSPDGNRIYYRPLNQGIQEREIASGKERVVVSGSGANGPFSLSPDGRWIAWYDRSTLQSIVVIRVEDGQSREVFRTSDGGLDVIPMPWTPDSSAVLVRKYLGTSGGSELWLVPVNGGVPRKLDIDLTGAIGGQLGKIRLSPDGKRLAYVVGKSYRSETWVLENFLPALKAGR